MKQQAHGLSDTGRVRPTNEDTFFFDEELGIYIVCDGVGGHSSGEIASSVAAQVIVQNIHQQYETMNRYMEDPTPENRGSAIDLCRSSILEASEVVHRMGSKDDPRSRRSTTCVLLAVVGDNAVISHVGDSRAYLVRAGKAYQMTEDHSVGSEHYRRGDITHHDVGKDRYGTNLMRTVGFKPEVDIDTLNIEMMPGDRFVLCTDGLSDYLTAKELGKHVAKKPVTDAVKDLIDLANERGGKDNITCVIVEISGPPDSTGKYTADEKLRILRNIPLFENLTFIEMVKVLNILNIRRADAGETVIQEGRASDCFFIMLDGRAEVLKAGRRLAELGKGDYFGEMGLIDDSPRSADVVVNEPSRLLFIRRADFQSLVTEQLHLSQQILHSFCTVLTQRIRSTNRMIAGEEVQDSDL
jgi:serine/threonine protein phosphatase PrpC